MESFYELMITLKLNIEKVLFKYKLVACHNCCKFVVALYPDSTHSSKDKYLLPVIQSSLISIMIQTATLRSD